MKGTVNYLRGKGISKRGATAIVAGTLALGVGGTTVMTTLPAHAATEHAKTQRVQSARPASVDDVVKGADKLNKQLRELLGSADLAPGGTVPKEKLTTLLADQIASKDPSLSPKLVHKTAAAIGDLVNLAVRLDPQQLAQLGAGGQLLATSIAQIAASSAASQPPSVDSVVGTVKGGGMVGAATLSLLIAGLQMYEASANVPQVADMLDLMDPTTKDGAKVFSALPKELRTPELKQVLHMFTDFGRTLNKVDKFKIMELFRQIAIIAAGQASPAPAARKSEVSRS
jgi:hypothetical protein